ncbi:MAG: bacteriophage abortive infection AbiH family protein [Prevotella sp.]|nr:bacteriophage abortive infection AbiH family protein [Prevotella sp.]
MEGNNIVIVGNGFDVNHGLPSSYANFKEWLRANDKDLFGFLDRYIDVSGEWWNDFERNLSSINIPQLIREIPQNESQTPTITGLPPDFSHPASWKLDDIHKNVSMRFTDWAKSLDGIEAKKTVDLPKASLYISFNYTCTLERVYGIDENRIVYIHGKALRGDELIYGHGKNQFVLERDVMQRYGLYRSDDFLKAGTYGNSEYELTFHLSYWQKYIQLANYYDVLLPSVKNANMVYVYGLSFSEVDFPYIQWITEKNQNLKWIVSWHLENDKKCISETLRKLGAAYELFYM